MAHPTAKHAPELRIDIWQDEASTYYGTADQLIAEGLIPDSLEWPSADKFKRWSAAGFSYALIRFRPKDHKGPKSSWLTLDSWKLRVTVTGRDISWTHRKRLERKAEQLRLETRALTPQGKLEQQAHIRRHTQALIDKQFQSFKALVPGLTRGNPARQITIEVKGAAHV